MKFPPASKQIKDLLIQAIEGELQGIIQYMWQHTIWSGIPGFAVKDELKDIAIQEMQHAEAIADRLRYMGGIPPIQPNPINLGNNLSEMLESNVTIEVQTINLYRQIIETAISENDAVTKVLFEKILSDEESHHDSFTTLLENNGAPPAIANLMASLKNLPSRR